MLPQGACFIEVKQPSHLNNFIIKKFIDETTELK